MNQVKKTMKHRLPGIFAGLLIIIATVALPTAAQAGQFNAQICNPSLGAVTSGGFINEIQSGVIQAVDNCAESQYVGSRVIPGPTSSAVGVGREMAWTVPSSTGLSFAGLYFRGNFKDDSRWAARVTVSGSGKPVTRPDSGQTGGEQGWTFGSSLTKGQGFSALPDTKYRRISLGLFCRKIRNSDPRTCPRQGVNAYGYMKNIAVTVRDSKGPSIEASDEMGRLFSRDVLYGDRDTVALNLVDQGSGVKSWSITVNGTKLPDGDGRGSFLAECKTAIGNTTWSIGFYACPKNPEADTTTLDTYTKPFQVVDAETTPNTVRICATDFSNEQNCVEKIVRLAPVPVAINQPSSGEQCQPVALSGRVGSYNNAGVSGVVQVRKVGSSKWSTGPGFVSADNGRWQSSTKFRAKRKGKTRYQVRAKVTRAPDAYPGATSKVKTFSVPSCS